MIKNMFKVHVSIAFITLLSTACGVDIESDSNISSINHTKSIQLVTGANDTFLKRSLPTNTKNEAGRGSEFCALYAFSKYKILSEPVKDGKHFIVKIVGFTEKGCDFSSG